jgi:cell wall-associated NlpC family hydrolase
MARYTAEQIYAFAREAGFSPDRAATMTAIALAESRGNSSAHNPVGEDSKGLWQINQRAHPGFASVNLFDPVQNARAAFKVSQGGDDISPWTTTHKGAAAKYLRYKMEAQAAAASYGDGPNRGMWDGVSGYGDHTSAGDPRGGGQGVAPTQSTTPAAASDNVNVQQVAAPNAAAAAEAGRGEASGIPLDEDLLAGTDAAVGSAANPVGTPAAGAGATAAPVVQGITNPATNVPTQPGTNVPTQAPTQAPVQPGSNVPVQPGSNVPVQPGGQPAVPGTGQPAVPGVPDTGRGSASGVPLDEQLAAMAQQPVAAPVAPVANQSVAQSAGQQLPRGDGSKLQTFLNSAVAQTGDKYVFGHEVKLNDPNPTVFDCSELVEWAAAQSGVKMPDGSWLQYRELAKEGTTMSVEQALKTPGALLFSFSSDPMSGGRPSAAHVAISLGNGKTIEAKGTQYGVGSWEANTKRFQYAGVIPELGAGIGGVPPAPPPQQPQVDAFTYRVNNDPAQLDRNPSTMAISHTLTNADPPPEPIPLPQAPPAVALNAPQADAAAAAPLDRTEASSQNDANNDNQDDVLQNIQDWVAPQDHSVPDNDGYHDNLPGHT